MRPLTPVAITGLGVIGATGRGFAAMDAALRAGREGVGEISLWESSLTDFPVGQYRGNLAADLGELLGDVAPAPLRTSRSDMLALAASAEALQQAGLDRTALSGMRAGAHVG